MSAIQLYDDQGLERFSGKAVGGGGSQPVLTVSTVLAHADIVALHASPITLVAAVANTLIVPLFLWCYPVYVANYTDPGGATFSITNGDLYAWSGDFGFQNLSFGFPMLDSGRVCFAPLNGDSTGPGVPGNGVGVGLPLILKNEGSSEWTDGNAANKLRVQVWYMLGDATVA